MFEIAKRITIREGKDGDFEVISHPATEPLLRFDEVAAARFQLKAHAQAGCEC